jgi:hypothetical protein
MNSSRPRNRINLPTFGAELFTYLKDVNDHESFKASRRIKDLLSVHTKQEITQWFTIPSLPELDQTLLRKITNSLLSPGQTGEKRTKEALAEIRFNSANMERNININEATTLLREWSRDFRSAKGALDHHYKCINAFLRFQKVTNDENVRHLLKLEIKNYDDFQVWLKDLIKYWNEKSIVKSNMRNSYEKAFHEFTSSFDSTLQNNNFGKALDSIWHQYLGPEIISRVNTDDYVNEAAHIFESHSDGLPAYEIDLQIESGQIHYAVKCNKLSEFQVSELRFKISLGLSKHTEFRNNNFTVSFLSGKHSTIVIKADIPADESSVSTMVKFLEEVLEESKYPG